MLGDLAGTGPLREALLETNALLAQVLDELRATNGQQLETVATELRAMHATLRTIAPAEPPATDT